jgi:hypothetical protein
LLLRGIALNAQYLIKIPLHASPYGLPALDGIFWIYTIP